ncbi:hypothetical protein [Oceanicola sp. 502str15]|uniref:hypothetical protein n=1 Tax=Oceanicola sp. 502str15 TaxID=2696061 RepID=UPI0020955468|nr:hypothetical protein [Oceanicola sp. 502str15]MCO6382285.1 hypothetical protein [Oceanicola sp. 502str15]
MSTWLLVLWGLLLLAGVIGVALILRKGPRKPRSRALSSHRPDARDMPQGLTLNDRSVPALGHREAVTEHQAEQARHRRSVTQRAEADAKAERARRLRPWDHH